MGIEFVNGVGIHCEIEGDDGPSLVLVHGSWGDHEQWQEVASLLASSFRVLSYDRRGHSRSDAPPGPGSVRDDVADLAGLIEHFELAPACVVGSSFGGSIALRLAGERPELVRGAVAHEPPLFSLLAGDPAAGPALAGVAEGFPRVLERLQAGDHPAAVEAFFRIALGAEEFDRIPGHYFDVFATNAPTFLDEAMDPEQLAFDSTTAGGLDRPVLLTTGARSQPMFSLIAGKLEAAFPRARRATLADAGHLPHVTHPREYADTIAGFVRDPIVK